MKKLPPVWRAFVWFIVYAAFGIAIAICLVFLADAISPALGAAAGKWALIVAIFVAYRMAKVKEDEAKQEAPSPALPDPILYYYREGSDGAICGPETLAEIRRVTAGQLNIEIVEARGQPYGNLKRATWEKLTTPAR